VNVQGSAPPARKLRCTKSAAATAFRSLSDMHPPAFDARGIDHLGRDADADRPHPATTRAVLIDDEYSMFAGLPCSKVQRSLRSPRSDPGRGIPRLLRFVTYLPRSSRWRFPVPAWRRTRQRQAFENAWSIPLRIDRPARLREWSTPRARRENHTRNRWRHLRMQKPAAAAVLLSTACGNSRAVTVEAAFA